MVKVSCVSNVEFAANNSLVGKVSFNDGLTFNFSENFGKISLTRSKKLPVAARSFRSQNHEIATLKALGWLEAR